MKHHKITAFVFTLLFAAHIQPISHASSSAPISEDKKKAVLEAIRKEVSLPAVSDVGYPLPLTSTWNIGIFHYRWENRPRGADPAWQLEQIEMGHHFLPTFAFPGFDFDDEKYSVYLYPPFEKVRDYQLPFVFMGSQWERHLTELEEYFNLPPEQNPNVLTPEGEILKKVDPFGPTEPWYEVGKKITDHAVMAKLQEIYPNPPRIIFLSNNEHSKLTWHEAETSQRYLEKYGPGKPDAFKRKVVGDAWIEKYRALQKGMRDGLKNENWQKNVIFIAYGGDVGMEAMGRWGGWMNYSLHSQGRISIAPFMWDGVSPSYYMAPYTPNTDYQVSSNQIQTMNTIFAIQETYKINPDFWYEMSTWDGHVTRENPKWKSRLESYREAGQVYDMERYRGWIQFGLWLQRPRAVRLYEDWIAPLETFEEKFKNVERVVDRLYKDETLQRYWRKGELVANKAQAHPYQHQIPNEIAIKQRWFLLDTDLTPPRPWKLSTEIPVFSLALQLGESPNRSWLVYAHAPLKNYQNVQITIPDWKSIPLDVSREGVFYEIQESDESIKEIEE